MSVELIAEVSSNHGGDITIAKDFIWACAEAGADWVKFQTTRVAHLSPADPQYAWFKKAELSEAAHVELRDECTRAGVKFLTTVFNAAEVPFLASLGLEAIKIGSGEAVERNLAEAVRPAFPRVLVSLGIARWGWRSHFYHGNTRYLRCVSRYPHPAAAALGDYDDVICGWSDHAAGIEGCQLAILNGATVIEKHVQLPHQARPAKAYEATMDELKALRQFADERPERFLGRWQFA